MRVYNKIQVSSLSYFYLISGSYFIGRVPINPREARSFANYHYFSLLPERFYTKKQLNNIYNILASFTPLTGLKALKALEIAQMLPRKLTTLLLKDSFGEHFPPKMLSVVEVKSTEKLEKKESFLQWLKTNVLFEIEPPFLILEYKEFEITKGTNTPKVLKPLKSVSGVYAWYCVVTGKIYIGGAANLFLRGFKAHYLNRSSNKHLQEAIRLHGLTNFLFVILKISGNIGEIGDITLINDEQFFLDAFPKTVKFNIAPLARSNRGIIRTEETKRRISEAMIGKNVGKSYPQSPESKAARSAALKGLVRSEETKAKISASKKGIPLSAEHKAALVAAWVRRRARNSLETLGAEPR